ncbi:GGDEF domain-containing protein [bacterium]|nr:GGDEF domain-containing protein [bacterium]
MLTECDNRVLSLDNLDESLRKKWKGFVESFDFAFQPIVNIYSGECYGLEALLRNYDAAGFSTIQDVFDAAYADSMLYYLDSLLKPKVLEKFTQIPFHKQIKILYNIDNRTLVTPEYMKGNSLTIIDRFHLHPGSFCYEISERHDCKTLVLNNIKVKDIKSMLRTTPNEIIRIAIDDFGVGFSGLELLYHSEPDIIKIDRFFIAGIAGDSRKKLCVETTVRMAHTMGITVIAEGVETADEIFECKKLGCDYVQGFFIQRPTLFLDEIKKQYNVIADITTNDNRSPSSDHDIIISQMQKIKTINLHDEKGDYTSMCTVLEGFRKNYHNFFPVINGNGEPVGVIRERDLKDYVYSPYGKDILKNKSSGNILKFITKIPVSEIRTQVETILGLFSTHSNGDGILLSENGRYVGFLDANALLMALNEKNIAEAREQNPLTKLPGNNAINRYISQALDLNTAGYFFVYFDFDNFKPLNDLYGFRQGDRAILLFSDILRKFQNGRNMFIGHIGGDDFFIGIDLEAVSLEESNGLVRDIINQFRENVKSIYRPEHQRNGYIISNDRNGRRKRYPLLEVSAGCLVVPKDRKHCDKETIFTILAELKKQAKNSADKYAFIEISDEMFINGPQPFVNGGNEPV